MKSCIRICLDVFGKLFSIYVLVYKYIYNIYSWSFEQSNPQYTHAYIVITSNFSSPYDLCKGSCSIFHEFSSRNVSQICWTFCRKWWNVEMSPLWRVPLRFWFRFVSQCRVMVNWQPNHGQVFGEIYPKPYAYLSQCQGKKYTPES